MNKILRLKSWVSLPEAAAYLCTVLSEKVSEEDVLQFSLEGHLTLSIDLPKQTPAKRGIIVPREGTTPAEYELSDGNPYVVDKEKKIDEHQYLRLEDEVSTISGLWDLPMLGSERLHIEDLYQEASGIPAIAKPHLNAVLLRNERGELWELQEKISGGDVIVSDGKISSTPVEYLSAIDLPKAFSIVVRTANLKMFEGYVLSLDSSTANPLEKPLGERERARLYRVVGALVRELMREDPDPSVLKPRYKSQSEIIDRLVDLYPRMEGISKSGLESTFADAKRSLANG